MKNFISLAFLACILLSFVTISESLPSLEKRTNCHLYKRNVLGKRTNEKKCPCALADSDFEDGPVRGLVVYAQDECGATTITGQFSKGFEDTSKNFTFAIVDKCGCTIRDLTCDLKVQFTGDGGSKTFSKKVEDLNLNCDQHGLLLNGSSPYNKRNCYTKRDLGDFTYYPNVNAYMRINSDGDGYAQAAIDQI